MDDSGHRENGRYKPDQSNSVHTQWMWPQHQMKEHHTERFMAVMSQRDNAVQEYNFALAEKEAALAERDNAVQERNLVLNEKKTALTERDMAIFQRDAAITERNSAILERDNAISALEYAREISIHSNGGPAFPPGGAVPSGTTHIHQNHHHHLLHVHPPAPQYTRDIHITEVIPISTGPESAVKAQRAKQSRRESGVQLLPSKKVSKPSRKYGRDQGEDPNMQVTNARPYGEWEGQEVVGGEEDRNKQASVTKHDWKNRDLGLNQVTFDESTMPVPVCSCTGKLQQCYKWGNGGWQSACCTNLLSMYPLPENPTKRHYRVSGRKMSGNVFTKLLSRMAAEGHDLSIALDLKDHWARHGTNRYITIK